jgi:hypothetical protein
LKERFARVRAQKIQALSKPGSARIHPPYVSAQSILGGKVLRRSLEELYNKKFDDGLQFFYMRECSKYCPNFYEGVYLPLRAVIHRAEMDVMLTSLLKVPVPIQYLMDFVIFISK